MAANACARGLADAVARAVTSRTTYRAVPADEREGRIAIVVE
jgi:hypothetical protein